jgi:mono/diheme cytochrome c family protein
MIADPQQVSPVSDAANGHAMSTRELVTRYSRVPGNAEGAVTLSAGPAPDASGSPNGAALYAKWCAACHGETGRGDGSNAASLPVKPAVHSSRDAMSPRPDDSLFDTIAAGGAVMNRSPRMPAFGATLSPGEIRALVRHIRTLCRCEGPSWSRTPGPGR